MLLVVMPFHQIAMSDDLPELEGRVSDPAGILSERHRRELAERLDQHAEMMRSDVVVAIVGRQAEVDLQAYGRRLSLSWQKGQPGEGSVLLLIAPLQKQAFIFGDQGPDSQLKDVVVVRTITRRIVSNLEAGAVSASVRYGAGAILATHEAEFDWTIVFYLAGGLVALFGLSLCFTTRSDLENEANWQLREQRKGQKPVGSPTSAFWSSGGGGTSGAGVLDLDQGGSRSP